MLGDHVGGGGREGDNDGGYVVRRAHTIGRIPQRDRSAACFACLSHYVHGLLKKEKIFNQSKKLKKMIIF